jgi:hypothetical protein
MNGTPFVERSAQDLPWDAGVKWRETLRSIIYNQKRRLLLIAALALFTPVTSVSMPNPAMEHPGKFASFRQMMKYYNGLKKHGLAGRFSLVEIAADGEEMYFYRDGERCRI